MGLLLIYPQVKKLQFCHDPFPEKQNQSLKTPYFLKHYDVKVSVCFWFFHGERYADA